MSTNDQSPPPWMDEVPWGDEAGAPPPPGPRIVTEEERVQDDLDNQPDPEVWWTLNLKKIGSKDDAKWVPLGTPANIECILRRDRRWVGKIRTNDFTGDTEVHIPTEEAPGPMTTVSMIRIRMWIERVYSFVPKDVDVGAVILSIGDENKYHPIAEHLRSLKWDGMPRVNDMLTRYFKAEDSELHRAFAKCWMVSAVARAMEPGSKVDTALILVGSQGARKSTACRVLAGSDDLYSDTLLDFNSKDLYESLYGVWIYELAELDSFGAKEQPKVKAVLSSRKDRYRRPYAKGPEARKRQAVFIGTTNEAEFLGDRTGSRRFWPVRVGKVDIEALEKDRDALWAEAVMLYDAGEQWWLSDALSAELKVANSEYTVKDPWDSTITNWVEEHVPNGRQGFTIATVLIDALGMEIGKSDMRHQKRAGSVLRGMGYKRRRKALNGRFVSLWYRG